MRKLIPITGAVAVLIITSVLSGCGGTSAKPVAEPTTTSGAAHTDKIAADAKAATAAKAKAAAEAKAKAATAAKAKAAAEAKAEAAAAAKAEVAVVPPPAAPVESVYYANCTAVRAAGADPIYRGDPGYSGKLDRDGDGVACE